jgi:hypothetical protein
MGDSHSALRCLGPVILVATQLVMLPRAGRARLVPPALLAAAFACVLMPWTLRNYQVFDRFVLVATNGGSTFYGGNNDVVLQDPAEYGAWVATNYLPGRDLIEAEPDEVSHDKMEWHLGLQWVREHGSSLPRLFFFKLARLVLPDLSSPNRTYVLLQGVCTAPFLLLFAAGAFACLRDRSYWTAPWFAVHGTLACTVVTTLVFYGSTRFRDANAPLFMLYVVIGLRLFRMGRPDLPERTGSACPEEIAPTRFEAR